MESFWKFSRAVQPLSKERVNIDLMKKKKKEKKRTKIHTRPLQKISLSLMTDTVLISFIIVVVICSGGELVSTSLQIPTTKVIKAIN